MGVITLAVGIQFLINGITMVVREAISTRPA
jgi:hypothetical protein